MDSIYSYDNYRKFLQDYYYWMKSNTKNFTYELFSKKAKIASKNYLKLVMDGKRNLSIEYIMKFAKALDFSFDETQYFETLVHHDQEENTTSRQFYKHRLNAMKKTKSTQKSKKSSNSIFAKWYAPSALLCFDKLSRDEGIKVAKKELGINVSILDSMFDAFVRNQYLISDEDIYKLNYDHYVFEDTKKTSFVFKEYLKSQLENSRRALREQYDKGGQFFSHSFTYDPDQIEYITQKIQDFLDDITNETSKNNSKNLMQLNIQMFKTPKVKKEEL